MEKDINTTTAATCPKVCTPKTVQLKLAAWKSLELSPGGSIVTSIVASYHMRLKWHKLLAYRYCSFHWALRAPKTPQWNPLPKHPHFTTHCRLALNEIKSVFVCGYRSGIPSAKKVGCTTAIRSCPLQLIKILRQTTIIEIQYGLYTLILIIKKS